MTVYLYIYEWAEGYVCSASDNCQSSGGFSNLPFSSTGVFPFDISAPLISPIPDPAGVPVDFPVGAEVKGSLSVLNSPGPAIELKATDYTVPWNGADSGFVIQANLQYYFE